MAGDDLDNRITAAVLEAVLACLADEEGPGVDTRAVIRGMSSAMFTLAYTRECVEEARAIMQFTLDQLDDPATRHWAMTNTITDQ